LTRSIVNLLVGSGCFSPRRPRRTRGSTSRRAGWRPSVLDDKTVVYLDRTGSGNETAAHLKADGRLTIMFCAFEGPPNILRLYGRGEVLRRGSAAYDELLTSAFAGEEPIGARQMIRLHIDLVKTSCGYGMPVYAYRGNALRSTIGRAPRARRALRPTVARRTWSALTACRPDGSTKPEVGHPKSSFSGGRWPSARVIVVLWLQRTSARRIYGPCAIADHVGLSASHFQHVFKRWAGLTPKAFLQAITIERARELLRDSASVLDTAYDVGLSGPSRLHDLFVAHEALTPGDYRRDDLILDYGFHPSPFGEAIVVATPRGMTGLGFVDDGNRAAALADMARRWPRARLVEDERLTAPYADRAFDPALWRPDAPLRVVLIGTDFELRVWETLLRVPMGRATTYSDIACKIGKPTAARAVGAAVGKNPISFVVPCHRVLGRSGALTGYHWGLARKQAIIGWEAGRTAA
jgi:AraC family transcriptional regulator of adaptative response/methylated-DNA-[protein]-cysteine methyltransferase